MNNQVMVLIPMEELRRLQKIEQTMANMIKEPPEGFSLTRHEALEYPILVHDRDELVKELLNDFKIVWNHYRTETTASPQDKSIIAIVKKWVKDAL